MDSGFRHIEIFSHKWSHRRNLVAHFLLEIFCDFGYYRWIHSVQGASERSIFKNHGFQRNVARALADPKQGAVHCACAVEPSRGSVCHRLIEIVVPMPLDHVAWNPCVILQPVYNSRYASRKGRAGVRHSIAHGIAGSDFYRHPHFMG